MSASYLLAAKRCTWTAWRRPQLSILAIGCVTTLLVAPVAGAPVSTVFHIAENSSSLTVELEARGFTDTDTQELTGTIDATFDFGSDPPFSQNAAVTVTGAHIAALAPFEFRLGLPRPFPGADVVASGIVADVTTPVPPGTMEALPTGAIRYQFDASQFLITADEGIIETTGFVNDTTNLADEPVSGASPPGTLGEIVFSPGDVVGFYREVGAFLDLPISISAVAMVGDPGEEEEVLLELDATVRASASFYWAFSPIPGDFDQDGDVDGADLPLWQAGFGTASGAGAAGGDADHDQDVDGADFLIWQRNLGTAPPAAVAGVPEPAATTIALAALVGVGPLVRRRRTPR
jgi:hypothetical protein